MSKMAIGKTVLGAGAAAAMALASTPAMARDHDDGIGPGEIVAGALVIGGIAAIAASAGNHDGYRYDRAGYDRYDGHDRYDRRGYARAGVEQCVGAARYEASRYGRRANVTQIRDIDRTPYGLRVKGRVEVERGYGRGYGYGRHGITDRGQFTCFVDRGRVTDVRLTGLGNRR